MWRKQQPLRAFGLAGGREFAVGVVAGGAYVGIVEQRAIGPLEIEHQPQRFAHPAVAEQIAARVHEQRLGLGRNLVRYLGATHVAAGHGWKAIAVAPVLCLILYIEVEFAGLEGFEGDMVVAVELHLDAVEVVFAAIDRQILAPPVLHPLEHQAPARYHLNDAVGTAAQRRLEGGALEVAIFPIVLRQDRQFTQAQDQQRVAGALEDETDAVAAENIDAFHFLQIGAVLRVAVVAQQAIGEGHVIGRDRLAIVKTRFRTQVEDHPTAVLAVLDASGDQAIAGGRLIPRGVVSASADHQGFVQLIGAVLQEMRGRDRAAALERVGVERIESTGRHDAQRAAFGRIGVDPVKMTEAGRILECPELGVAVALADSRRGGKAQGQAEEQQ